MSSPCPQLALIGNEAPAAPPETLSARRARRLWLCVHLPRLAVDVSPGPAGVPRAAVEPTGKRLHVVACDDVAVQRGIRPGLSLTAALALCPELVVRERDAGAECALLNGLAAAAWDLSATVSLYERDSIVLEIGASLALFGGFAGVMQRARDVFSTTGAGFVFAVAGTARAAAWLARHVPGSYALFMEELPGLLRSLPVEVLGAGERATTALRRSGVRTLGAVLRLPRAGLARRFGRGVCEALDQALGRAPEPLALYTPPQPFRAAEEIHPATDNWTHLAPLAGVLLTRLEHALLRRQAATQQVHCFLHHERAPVTVLRIETTRHERRAAVFLPLLQESFGRSRLPGPVVGIGIRCERMHVLPVASLDLVDGRAAVEQQWQGLLDQAAVRLGPGSLTRLQLHGDHRPERETVEKTGTDLFSPDCTLTPISSFAPARPAWLLARPEPLRCNGDRPHWRGDLDLVKWPERIETGWWDGVDVARDYYLARTREGTQLWVFRDRRAGDWYLHGVFG